MKAPRKTKIFRWLALNNKILTWENLQRQGWQALGRCPLHKQHSENVTHLFLKCHYSLELWDAVKRITKAMGTGKADLSRRHLICAWRIIR
jgi:hypothetical protein